MLVARFCEEGADRLLLLGDLLYHGPRNPLPEGYAPAQVAKLLNGYADRITAVRGNCDSEVDQMVLNFPLPRRLCAGSGREDDAAAHPWASGFGGRRCGGASCRIIRTLGPHPRERHRAREAAPAFAKGIAAARDTSGEGGAGTFAAPAVTFVNPGSVGHPKDGSASYAIYEHGTVELHQL